MAKPYKELKKKGQGDFALAQLSELVNQTFVVSHVRFGEADLGDYAIVTVEGVEYRTFSKVLLRELKTIQQYIEYSGESVEVTLKKPADYFIFE